MFAMSKPHLHMWTGQRGLILESHDFYVAQVKERVLAQFRDVAAETDKYSDAEYERLGSLPGDENSDMADVAEAALDRGMAFYELLSDLKKQMLLGALAGLYHQWDKGLREFIERELRNDMTPKEAAKAAWLSNSVKLLDTIEEFGWNIRAAGFFAKIDACRLIVNVYKHGKGPALKELAERFPQYLDDGFAADSSWRPTSDYVDHEWLSISESDFDEIAGALRRFWVEFPERLAR
jgi:hypothetical protein